MELQAGHGAGLGAPYFAAFPRMALARASLIARERW